MTVTKEQVAHHFNFSAPTQSVDWPAPSFLSSENWIRLRAKVLRELGRTAARFGADPRWMNDKGLSYIKEENRRLAARETEAESLAEVVKAQHIHAVWIEEALVTLGAAIQATVDAQNAADARLAAITTAAAPVLAEHRGRREAKRNARLLAQEQQELARRAKAERFLSYLAHFPVADEFEAALVERALAAVAP